MLATPNFLEFLAMVTLNQTLALDFTSSLLIWIKVKPSACSRASKQAHLLNPEIRQLRLFIVTLLIIDSGEATNTYKFIAHTVKPHDHTTHSHETLFTTRTYRTFAFSLFNADGWNAAVDPRYSPDHVTFPPSPLLTPPTRKGLGTKLANG